MKELPNLPKICVVSKNRLKKSDKKLRRNLLLASQNNPKNTVANKNSALRTLAENFCSNSGNYFIGVIFFRIKFSPKMFAGHAAVGFEDTKQICSIEVRKIFRFVLFKEYQPKSSSRHIEFSFENTGRNFFGTHINQF